MHLLPVSDMNLAMRRRDLALWDLSSAALPASRSPQEFRNACTAHQSCCSGILLPAKQDNSLSWFGNRSIYSTSNPRLTQQIMRLLEAFGPKSQKIIDCNDARKSEHFHRLLCEKDLVKKSPALWKRMLPLALASLVNLSRDLRHFHSSRIPHRNKWCFRSPAGRNQS